MKKLLVIILAVLFFGACPEKGYPQTDSVWNAIPRIRLTGFADLFYSFDFNLPETNYRQSFFYSHNRHNEFNLNTGFVKISADHSNYRANFALHAGTYVDDNYAQEPGSLKNIYEANCGIALSKKNNLWLDAGIFSSHIGFESAISIDNWTLTRSIPAENTPYYLSGVKITFIPNAKWELAALICNGWQRIRKVQGNSMPSFGTQIKYFHGKKTFFNWSTFAGTDDPDTIRRIRYFSNFYVQTQPLKKFGVVAGFDVGIQQQIRSGARYNVWFSLVVIASYNLNSKWATALRAEYFRDETGIIISTEAPNGFKTSGFSLNIDYCPIANLACRIEGRWLHGYNKIFERDQVPVSDNIFITTSVAVRFNGLISQ